ncbi:LysE family translocator [Nocardia sp. CS682]|uniref:LysE family translocator n=1 Tax=Nocardia sp. CS682 TaxID=1047172 RepID=UPI001074E655|nr:LysE family translocator [Nocardia sp. CS682]QBS45360.1 LysE family translocator [Nocardia sp. CS682]
MHAINWVGFLPTALLVSLIPGASQILGLNNAVRHGIPYALAGVGGRLAAFVVLVALVVAGLGAALAASVTALTVIKWAGVAYLAWIGIQALRRAWRPAAIEAPTQSASTVRWRIVGNEFAVGISNPKALLLFAALLPQFAAASAGGFGTQIALLGAAYAGIEFVVGLGYVVVGGLIGATGFSARTSRRIDLGTAVCFLGLAGLLAADGA